MLDIPTPADPTRSEQPVSMGQSIAIAVASALLMFTVVGLIASHGALSGARSTLTPSVFAVRVPEQSAGKSALQPVAARVKLQPQPSGNGFEITVPAGQPVVLETGLPGTGSDGADGDLMLPALQPGHYILNVGMHDVLVTAVDR